MKKIRLCAFADEAADSIEGQIAALKRNGIGLLELRSVDGINVADMSVEKAEEVYRALSANGIAVWSIGSPIGKSEITEDFSVTEKKLKHILDLCKVFRCDKIRVFSFFNAYGSGDEVIKRMSALVKIAGAENVALYHENEKEIYGDTAERVDTILDSVADLNSIFDPANYIQVGEKQEKMARVRRRAAYYHIKDALYSGEVVPSGEGAGQIAELIKELDRDTVLTLEPHLSVFTGYAAIDGTELKNKYTFNSRDAAFDAAVGALKKLLTTEGFTETDGAFVKEIL